MKNKKLIISISIVLALIVAGVLAAVLMNSKRDDSSNLQVQLELGQRYLQELEYDQAVAAFTMVLEIDPRNVDAYMGLAEAYVLMGNADLAVETLEKGIEMVADQRLNTYLAQVLEIVHGENVPVQDSNDTTSSNTAQGSDNSERMEREDYNDFYILSYYDANGFLYRKERFDFSDILLGIDYFNEYGMYRVDSYENGIISYVWYYDENGRCVKQEYYRDGVLSEITENIYNEEGKLEKRLYMDGNGGLYCVNEYIYEEDRVLMLVKHYPEDGEGYMTESRPDEKPAVLMIEYYSNDVFQRSSESFYDDNGNCIKSVDYDSSGNTIYYAELDYDANGNFLGEKQYAANGLLIKEKDQNYNVILARDPIWNEQGEIIGYKEINVETGEVKEEVYY